MNGLGALQRHQLPHPLAKILDPPLVQLLQRYRIVRDMNRCSSVECSSVVSAFCAIAAAVPPRPQDGTVSMIVLFTIVSSCLTDFNF